MATIAGGLPDGLAAVHAHFGDAVKLNVYDFRDRANPRQVTGWDKLELLRSEGSRENIATRLEAELERLHAAGTLGDAAYRQAAGKAPLGLVAGVDRSRADEREADARGRGIPKDHRAEAFLTLLREEVLKAYPELATAYASLDAMRRQLAATDLPNEYQSVVLDKVRLEAAERIRNNNLPQADQFRASERTAPPSDRTR